MNWEVVSVMVTAFIRMWPLWLLCGAGYFLASKMEAREQRKRLAAIEAGLEAQKFLALVEYAEEREAAGNMTDEENRALTARLEEAARAINARAS